MRFRPLFLSLSVLVTATLSAGLAGAAPADAPASADADRIAEGSLTFPVWVHFADKGSLSPGEDAVAIERAANALTDRARRRRAKVRESEIADALDIPVHAPYVDAVTATGASLRTRSRWLNAVTVDATRAERDAIEALPFVLRVREVARGRRAPEPIVPVETNPGSPGSRAPNYGECSSQILPIEVDVLHDRGYSGAGVLVAVMDTGFALTHDSLQGVNVVAEWDFVEGDGVVANEPGDDPNQHNHGTAVLSILAGWDPGTLIGPAYDADFLLAKTEDLPTETAVEEDYWVAAAEWADSLGADVISTSLSYIDWYTYADMDGETAPITIAADLASANGIAVFGSAGNQGGGSWFYIGAPADGNEVITVGAVDSLEVIAGFSSHGPTFDGRTKPDLCAMGYQTLAAIPTDDHAYGRGNGTSFSCPLAAGVGALLLESHPNWTPNQLREAMRTTASRAGSPDNDYGWGVIRGGAADDAATGVADAPPPAPSGLRLALSPNPTSGAATIRWSLPPGTARGRLTIVDVAGRRVRDIGEVVDPSGFGGGSGEIAWDGRDESGRRVAAGLRFARLETDRGVGTARLVHVGR